MCRLPQTGAGNDSGCGPQDNDHQHHCSKRTTSWFPEPILPYVAKGSLRVWLSTRTAPSPEMPPAPSLLIWPSCREHLIHRRKRRKEEEHTGRGCAWEHLWDQNLVSQSTDNLTRVCFKNEDVGLVCFKNECGDFPDGPVVKTPCCQCRECRFCPGLGN